MIRDHRTSASQVMATLIVSLLLGLLAALWMSAGRVEAANPDHVEIVNLAYSPPTLTTQVGHTVTWDNGDGLSHTATSDAGAPEAFDSSTIAGGDSYTFTFTLVGTYAYHCEIHASMHGTIVVEAAAASPTPIASVPDGAVGGGASPTGLTVLVSLLSLLGLLGLAAIATRRAALP